jgi:hypothetical protein
MKIIYRISDAGYNKVKPDYVTMKMFNRMLYNVFLWTNMIWSIIADNCS